MRKNRMVVANTDENFVRTLRESLIGDDSIEVVASTNNGIEAIRMIHDYNPDIILLDVVLPGLDGFGVMGAIQGPSRTGIIPKIIVTSEIAIEHFVTKAIQLGACYYMVRPIDNETLKTRIKEFACNDIKKNIIIDDTVDEVPLGQALVRAKKSIEERLTTIFLSVGLPSSN